MYLPIHRRSTSKGKMGMRWAIWWWKISLQGKINQEKSFFCLLIFSLHLINKQSQILVSCKTAKTKNFWLVFWCVSYPQWIVDCQCNYLSLLFSVQFFDAAIKFILSCFSIQALNVHLILFSCLFFVVAIHSKNFTFSNFTSQSIPGSKSLTSFIT